MQAFAVKLILGSGLTFPANAFIAFKFEPPVASRTLYIDDIFYEAVPVLPVFTANKTEIGIQNLFKRVFKEPSFARTLFRTKSHKTIN